MTRYIGRYPKKVTCPPKRRTPVEAGDGSIRWQDGAVNGSFVTTVSDLSTIAPDVLPAWSPSGRGRIEVTAGGNFYQLRADATFAFDEVTAAGRDLGAVVGEAWFDAAEGLRIGTQFPDLATTVEASLDLAGGDRTFEIRGNVSEANLARLIPPHVPVSARVTLEAMAGRPHPFRRIRDRHKVALLRRRPGHGRHHERRQRHPGRTSRCHRHRRPHQIHINV